MLILGLRFRAGLMAPGLGLSRECPLSVGGLGNKLGGKFEICRDENIGLDKNVGFEITAKSAGLKRSVNEDGFSGMASLEMPGRANFAGFGSDL